MPLGFENNGVSAGLIERGGEFLSKQIQQTGQVIEGALIRNQAFKQAQEFGSQLSQINPQSDDFPQAAAALASQYPLALQSGLAKPIIEPMAKAYAGFQASKRAQMEIQGRKDISGIVHGGGNGPVFIPGSKPSPDLPDANADPLAGGTGLGSSLSQGINSSIRNVEQQSGMGLLPPDAPALPDAASAMKQRASRPLQSYIDEASNTYNQALAAKQNPPFRISQISTIAARQKAADDKQIAAESKANAPQSDLHESATVPGILLTKGGTPLIRTDTGVARPAGMYEQERLNQAKAAAEQRTARAEKKDVSQSAQAEYTDAAKDFSEQDRLLHSLEKDAKKITDADALAAHQKVTVEQQQRAQAAKDRKATALKAYRDSLAGTTREIVERNGKKYEVDHATKKVIREIE